MYACISDGFVRILLLESHLLSYQLIVFGFRNDVNELLELYLDVVYVVSIYVIKRGAGRSILRPY